MTDLKNIHKDPHTVKQPEIAQQTVIAKIFSPLPPPEMLASYEHAQAGLINKIIEMIETESTHRRDLEKQKMLAELSDLQNGDKLIARAQIFALILSISALTMGCVTAILGAQITGSIIGTLGLAGIIAAFIKNSKRDK